MGMGGAWGYPLKFRIPIFDSFMIAVNYKQA